MGTITIKDCKEWKEQKLESIECHRVRLTDDKLSAIERANIEKNLRFAQYSASKEQARIEALRMIRASGWIVLMLPGVELDITASQAKELVWNVSEYEWVQLETGTHRDRLKIYPKELKERRPETSRVNEHLNYPMWDSTTDES